MTANFKETQLAGMRPGQPVDISVDACPDHTFHGNVDSFQPGSGSAFSLLPARERHRQLRQGRAARAGEDRVRRCGPTLQLGARHVGRADASGCDERRSAPTSRSPSRSAAGDRNPWLIAVVVSIATFMEVLDTTIANVALRHIAGSLAASQDESTWIITSYLVANAICCRSAAGWPA